MLTWKSFFLSIMLVFLVNITYNTTRMLQIDFFASDLFYSAEIISILTSSIFIALSCYFFYSQKKSPDFESSNNGSYHDKSEPIFQPHKSAVYSDLTLIDNIPNLFCIKDHHGRWIQASSEYLMILELEYVDYFGKKDIELAFNANAKNSLFKESILQDQNAWKTRKTVTKSITTTLKNGDIIQIELVTTPIFNENNQPFRLLLSGQILRERQKELNKFELLTSIFSSSHLSFVVLDKDLKITSANVAFYSLLGYSKDELKTQEVSSIINQKDRKDFCKKIQTYFRKNDYQLWSEDIECQKANGKLIITKLEIKPIPNKNKAIENYFVTLEDITLNKKNEIRLSRIAHFDHLTGLVNRIMFLDRMAKFLSAAKRHKLHAVVFFIDLDKFKVVNDTLGHDAGDEVLKQTAKRLLAVTRKEDVVARFSGDEFAILLLNEKTHEKAIFSASLIADKVIKCLEQVFHINRREVFVGSSIGISIFPEDGVSSEQLLKNADFAMYEAKNKGRNNYQFYKKEYGEATQDRLALEMSLRKALAKHELQLFYQPQYNARSREISGAEVLIRWFKSETYDRVIMVPPDRFIPIAEETGLIIPIGAWIIETACRQLKGWLDQGLAIPQVSVNVSARQFMDEQFMQSVEDALSKAELDPSYLELEITESMLIGDLNKIELQLKRLKTMGVKIALDDFGTGYSSLSYLKKFPIDILKIDQSFIREMTVGSKDASIASAIIQMGHSLNQKVVAEGVENETQLMFLCEKKCDYIQGYYFSKPLPLQKMTVLLQEESTIR